MLESAQRSPSFFRVLIVEDNDFLQKFYNDALRIFGFHKITIVNNGIEAIEKLKYGQMNGYLFDFLIIDWEMPELSGIELLKFIRTSPDSPDHFMPILFATGMAQKRHVIQARDNGTTEFIAKPFKVEDLKNKIINLLTKTRNFILHDTYIGPCRRHHKKKLPTGMVDRRKSEFI